MLEELDLLDSETEELLHELIQEMPHRELSIKCLAEACFKAGFICAGRISQSALLLFDNSLFNSEG